MDEDTVEFDSTYETNLLMTTSILLMTLPKYTTEIYEVKKKHFLFTLYQLFGGISYSLLNGAHLYFTNVSSSHLSPLPLTRTQHSAMDAISK